MTDMNISDKPVLNPAALPVEAAAKMLGLPAGFVRKHLDSGAPQNADGTLNLIHYAAWLNLRLSHGD